MPTCLPVPEKTPAEIKVRVSEKGLLDEKGRPYGAKRALQVPKDTFLAGEKNRTHYRAYCILDCIGMEHLTNLLLQII